MAKKDKGLIFHFAMIIFWILSAEHVLFTLWAVMANGDLEMAALLPICFIQIPGAVVSLVTLVALILIRNEKRDKISAIIPMAVPAAQVVIFWIKICGIL